MDNISCYYNLDIDITSALNKNWTFPTNHESISDPIWIYSAETIFDPVFLKYTKCLGVPIISSTIFLRKPGSYHSFAHVDYPKNLSSAINWTINGIDSHMIWYELPNGQGSFKTNSAGRQGQIWNRETLTEISRYSILESPVLVRINIPHLVDMPKIGNLRWCISARLDFPDISWEEVVDNLLSRNIIRNTFAITSP